MERKKHILIVFILLFAGLTARANYRSEIYHAYVYNKMHDWKAVIDTMNRVTPKSDEFLLELVNYQYGYIGWCLGNRRTDEGLKYLDMAEKNIDILSGKAGYLSITNAYKSAFYGFRIMVSKLSAPFLGPKSMSCARKSVSADGENPFGYVQLGNIEFYMPAVFGGSKKEALGYYLKAEHLMEKGKNGTAGDWNYLSLLASVVQTYYQTGDYESAMSVIRKILSIEPEYDWVKNEMYQQVEDKLKSR
jgi:tetratricopeptide (TPR) repeat protein